MKDKVTRSLFVVAGMVSILPLVVLGQCSYSYSSYNNRCNGMICSSNFDCFSNYCLNGTCFANNELPPWAIFIIAFFAFLIFISALNACCRKRRHARLRNQ